MANSSSDPSRRQFFHKAGLAAGGLYALVGPSIPGPWVSGAEGAEKQHFYVSGRFGLELDNVFCGTLNQFEGGNYTADVVSTTQWTDRIPRKSLGIPKIEPNGEPVRKSGAIVELDQGAKEIGRRTFTNALLSEIEFPTCDATAKDQWKMTVSIVPEQLQVAGGSGKQLPPAGVKSKTSQVSNYRLNIQGLEQATQRATKIEAFAIKQKVAVVQSGGSKVSQLAPGPLEFPNLAVTVPESQAGLLYAWLDDFLVKGNNGPTKERPGVLEFLALDQKPVAAVQLYGLGVFRISSEGSPPGSEKIRRAKVDMYCQRMTATFTP
jgi:hypothetical protein